MQRSRLAGSPESKRIISGQKSSLRRMTVPHLHSVPEKLACIAVAQETYDLERIPLSGFSAEFRRYGEFSFRQPDLWRFGQSAKNRKLTVLAGDCIRSAVRRRRSFYLSKTSQPSANS